MVQIKLSRINKREMYGGRNVVGEGKNIFEGSEAVSEAVRRVEN
jgi:hypothetical protein